ncbi:alpha/beta hydrolase [Parasphingopyxis marina]|uniref:Alpha/beta fold hydrolase n=1 Tax=Parasphingopyxis marina TaxID=2761622 RepID=A0A842I136_9SPHN|nr:alpha/beta hydrolase [Parasphingopyxis marina]MBC2778403.1 alpha/beta fold hydrolase [Parasphingopyxis marina]
MSRLDIRLLGDFELARDGEPLALPASRKTRALLAFLIVTERPQRRERLCEIFWDLPDDPRAALRWSLSKLRPIVNEADIVRLVADRERAGFEAIDTEIDLSRIEARLADPTASADALTTCARLLGEELLTGIDLPDQPDFAAWLSYERERVERLRGKAVKRLLEHPDMPPDRAIDYAERWIEISPFSRDAANALIAAYRQMGRDREASHLIREIKSRFADADIEWAPEEPAPDAEPATTRERGRALLERQTINFCKAPDGVNIAYATVGEGPPLIKAANWLSHLEYDWEAPWSPLFRELAQDHRFIRYDERGNGLSDWNVEDLSLDTFVTDLETVVDTLGIERFPLLGISQGAAVSIEYAARHPERVSKLILFGGYPAGWRLTATPEQAAEREAIITLTKSGWGQDNPAYRHIFSATFMPSAKAEQLAWFDDFQRQTACAENAVRFLEAFSVIDVRHRLAEIRTETLVLHSRGDKRIPWEVGRDIAAAIPDASLVTLESDNHLLIEGEPAGETFVEAIREFLVR